MRFGIIFVISFIILCTFSSCESGAWIERYESIGIYPDSDNGHIYQLVLWERYYSYKRGCSSGGRNFTVVYYLIDYTLGDSNNQISYKPYKLAEADHRIEITSDYNIDLNLLLDKFCKDKPEFAAFLKTYTDNINTITPDPSLVQTNDSLEKWNVSLWRQCNKIAIFRNQYIIQDIDVVDKINDTLFFYTNYNGKITTKKLTIDSNYYAFDLLNQNDSCILALCNKKLDSLTFYLPFEHNGKMELKGPLKYVDLSAIPDTVKKEYGRINLGYKLSTNPDHMRIMWLRQKDMLDWMLYGFDEIWYLNDAKLHYYEIPYTLLTDKLAELR